MTALREKIRDLEGDVKAYGDYKTRTGQPADQRPQRHVRDQRNASPHGQDQRTRNSPPTSLRLSTTTSPRSTKPPSSFRSWVKVAVALALGMGTMVGWKRIVVTVGEKIGKEHLTYAQGATAELVAMVTIFAADNFGLPVSTTHVLSSGVAGTMAANKSGLQFSTIRNIAAAWVFTLPAAAILSGGLFVLFRQFSN